MVTGNDIHTEGDGERGGAGGAVRVVLVGRTGLEGAMRRERGITLLRPRTPLDAIGELAESADAGDGVRTLVVAGAEAVAPERVAGFVDAVRRIDAEARVYAVGDGAGAGFDGVLTAGLSGADVVGLARGGTLAQAAVAGRGTAAAVPSESLSPVAVAAPVAARSLEAVKQPAPEPETPRATAQAAASGVHESTPLGAILSGKDPVEAVLVGIRLLLGREARFVPEGAGGQEEVDARGAPVECNGRVLGRLVAEGMAPDFLVREAALLGGWITLHRQQEQLRRAAFTDELTGAWNRRYFQRFLGAAIDQAKAERRPVTLMVFDIDNFKTYNDRYGHAAGDEILVETVKLLTSVIRPSDRVCRIGGDEFGVVFHDPEPSPRNPGSPTTGKTPTSVADLARRFQKQICEHRFPKLLEDAPGTLTISGGLATYPWDGATIEGLLERADELAMQSKRQGKNAITLGPGATRACETGGT